MIRKEEREREEKERKDRQIILIANRIWDREWMSRRRSKSEGMTYGFTWYLFELEWN